MATDPEVAPGQRSLLRRLWCDLEKRISGALEFVGFVFYLIFSLRRVWLAMGGALAGLGLARCQGVPPHSHAGCLLSAGGAILGFFSPRTSK